MDEYLPPVVTRLKADWSDLRAALLESAAAMKAWAAAVRADVVDTLHGAGHDAGTAFTKAMKDAMRKGLDDDDDLIPKLRNQGMKAGASAGMGFGEMFSAALRPVLIAGIVALTPMIGAAIASAIILGLGLGFVGIAALAQKSNPELVKAATGFKDVVVAAFKDATAPMVAPMVAALGILAEGVKKLAAPFKEIFSIIGPAVPKLATGIVGMIEAMLPGLKESAPAMRDLIEALGTALPDIGAGFGGMIKNLGGAGPEMSQFIKDAGAVLGDVLPKLGTFLKDLTELYMFLEHGKGQGLGLFGGVELLAAAWPKVVEGAKAAWEWIKKVADAVGDWVSGTAGKVADWWNGMVEAVQTKGGQVQAWFEALPGRVSAWLSALPGRLRDAVVAGFDAFFFTLGFVGGKLFDFGLKILNFFHTLPPRVGAAAAQLWTGLKQRFTQGVADTELMVKSWAQRLPGILDKLMADIAAWGRKVWDTVTTWAARTVTDAFNWWTQLPGRIGGIIGNVAKTVKDWAGSAISWLFNAGKNMVEGLVNGAIAATDGAIAAIRRAIQRIIDGAKRALGIASPSTVFAEMGKFSMLGFVSGLQGERGMLARAWAGLAPTSPVVGPATSPALALAAAAAGGGGQAMFTGDIHIDGQRFMRVLIPIAQQRKTRTGSTGLS